MSGFDLQYGEYDDRDVSEDELWSSLVFVFSPKSIKNSSYKFGLIRSILDNLDNLGEGLTLSFMRIFEKFTAVYWDLIIKFNLRQSIHAKDNRRSAIEQILEDAKDAYTCDDFVPFYDLSLQSRTTIIKKVTKECKKYVIGALYEDTKRLFYSFSKKGEMIKLNPRMYELLINNKDNINRINNHEWAYFLSKVNTDYTPTQILNQFLTLAGSDSPVVNEDFVDNPIVLEDEKVYPEEELDEDKNTVADGFYLNDGGIVKRGIQFNGLRSDLDDDFIDDEEIKMLDDPILLIKYLKEKRGIHS